MIRSMFNNKVEVIENINSKLKLFKICDNISNTIFIFQFQLVSLLRQIFYEPEMTNAKIALDIYHPPT
jgi:hypothetical protein